MVLVLSAALLLSRLLLPTAGRIRGAARPSGWQRVPALPSPPNWSQAAWFHYRYPTLEPLDAAAVNVEQQRAASGVLAVPFLKHGERAVWSFRPFEATNAKG